MPVAAGIHYEVYHASRDGLALVLVHGAGGNILSWPPQVRRMPAWRVYALDLPGHGASPPGGAVSIESLARSLIAWMDVMGLERAVLGGHSMGSAICLQTALDEPARVAGLCLLGSAARLSVHPALLELTGRPETALQAVEKVIGWSFNEDADVRLKIGAARSLAATPTQVLHSDLLACSRFDVSARLSEIACPVLLVSGEKDRMTPPRLARELAAGLQGSRYVELLGRGHFVMQEAPGEVQTLLEGFLAELSPSPPGANL